MLIDVSSILKVTGAKIVIDCTLPLTQTDFLGGSYEFISPIEVKGSIYNNGKSLFLKAACSGRMRTQCSRCLSDVEVNFDFDLEEQLLQNDGGEAADDENVILFDGYTFELDEIVLDNFLMNINGSYLCDEDCKGLCPDCGKNLNEGECTCEHVDIDPRWATLLDIMQNSENDE